MMATAEFVVPKSMPITCPLTFSSAYPLVHDAPNGDLRAFVRKVDDARGRNWHSKLAVADGRKKLQQERQLTLRDSREASMIVNMTRLVER